MIIMEQLHETESLPTMSRRGYDGHGLCGKTGKIQNNDHYGTIAWNRITTDRINIISIMIRKHKHMLNECGLRLLENAVCGLRRPRRRSLGTQNKIKLSLPPIGSLSPPSARRAKYYVWWSPPRNSRIMMHMEQLHETESLPMHVRYGTTAYHYVMTN